MNTLFQFQCQREGCIFYYAHGSVGYARHCASRCPVCGSTRVKPTGREWPNWDDYNPPVDQNEIERSIKISRARKV